MKSVEDYKESISERYIQDFKKELDFFDKIMIAPIVTKMKSVLKSNKKIEANNLEDLEDLWFWRKVLWIKIFDKQVFGSLLYKTLKFLKEKQEKILRAETEWRLDELLKLIIDWKLDVLEDHVDNKKEWDKKEWDKKEWDKKEWDKKEWDKKEWDKKEWDKKEWDKKEWDKESIKYNYKLSHEDFVKYFEWENFKQRDVGNCRLLATVDSLVSFWDYEKLIRSSVSKDEKGFKIRLPLWFTDRSKSKEYFVSFNELEKKQADITWNNMVLVDWKQGIQALVRAFLRHTSHDGNNLSDTDFLNLDGWFAGNAFNSLVYFSWMKTYRWKRNLDKRKQKEDLKWTNDINFVNQFYSVLKDFDPKYDMLTLTVCQLHETNKDRQNQASDNYDKLWHYSQGWNHEISVEAVHNVWWKLMITVSNPWDSGRSYDISFDELLPKCCDFSLCTKNIRKWLHETTGSYWEWSRKDKASDNVQNAEEIRNVNQMVELTWEENKELRKERGDIIVEKIDANKINVKSFNFTTQVEQKEWKIIIWKWKNMLAIPKDEISNSFNNKKNEVYRLYLYWAKIANMIHFIEKNYSKNNDELFLDDDWILKLDRTWPIPNTDIIKDWSKLWINKNSTKINFAKYLEKLWYKCEIKL